MDEGLRITVGNDIYYKRTSEQDDARHEAPHRSDDLRNHLKLKSNRNSTSWNENQITDDDLNEKLHRKFIDSEYLRPSSSIQHFKQYGGGDQSLYYSRLNSDILTERRFPSFPSKNGYYEVDNKESFSHVDNIQFKKEELESLRHHLVSENQLDDYHGNNINFRRHLSGKTLKNEERMFDRSFQEVSLYDQSRFLVSKEKHYEEHVISSRQDYPPSYQHSLPMQRNFPYENSFSAVPKTNLYKQSYKDTSSDQSFLPTKKYHFERSPGRSSHKTISQNLQCKLQKSKGFAANTNKEMRYSKSKYHQNKKKNRGRGIIKLKGSQPRLKAMAKKYEYASTKPSRSKDKQSLPNVSAAGESSPVQKVYEDSESVFPNTTSTVGKPDPKESANSSNKIDDDLKKCASLETITSSDEVETELSSNNIMTSSTKQEVASPSSISAQDIASVSKKEDNFNGKEESLSDSPNLQKNYSSNDKITSDLDSQNEIVFTSALESKPDHLPTLNEKENSDSNISNEDSKTNDKNDDDFDQKSTKNDQVLVNHHLPSIVTSNPKPVIEIACSSEKADSQPKNLEAVTIESGSVSNEINKSNIVTNRDLSETQIAVSSSESPDFLEVSLSDSGISAATKLIQSEVIDHTTSIKVQSSETTELKSSDIIESVCATVTSTVSQKPIQSSKSVLIQSTQTINVLPKSTFSSINSVVPNSQSPYRFTKSTQSIRMPQSSPYKPDRYFSAASNYGTSSSSPNLKVISPTTSRPSVRKGSNPSNLVPIKFETEEERRAKRLDHLEKELDKLKKQQAEMSLKKQKQDVNLQSKTATGEKDLDTLQREPQSPFKIQKVQEERLEKKIPRKINEYFDPGDHFCTLCCQSSSNLADHLIHLQSAPHIKAMDAKHKPWEKVKKTPEIPNTDVTLPLGGSEFILPIAGYYCELCNYSCVDSYDTVLHCRSEDHNQKFANFCSSNPEYILSRKALIKQIKAASTIAHYLPFAPQQVESNPVSTGSNRIKIKLPQLFEPTQPSSNVQNKRKRKQIRESSKSKEKAIQTKQGKTEEKRRKLDEGEQPLTSPLSQDQSLVRANSKSPKKTTVINVIPSQESSKRVSTENLSPVSSVSSPRERAKDDVIQPVSSSDPSSVKSSFVTSEKPSCLHTRSQNEKNSVIDVDVVVSLTDYIINVENPSVDEEKSISSQMDIDKKPKENSEENQCYIPGLSFINPHNDDNSSTSMKPVNILPSSPRSVSSSERSCEDIFDLVELSQPPQLEDLESSLVTGEDCHLIDETESGAIFQGNTSSIEVEKGERDLHSDTKPDNIFEHIRMEEENKRKQDFAILGTRDSSSAVVSNSLTDQVPVCSNSVNLTKAEKDDDVSIFSFDSSADENHFLPNRIEPSLDILKTVKSKEKADEKKEIVEDYRNLRPFVKLPIVPNLPSLHVSEAPNRGAVSVPINAILSRRTEAARIRSYTNTFDSLPITKETTKRRAKPNIVRSKKSISSTIKSKSGLYSEIKPKEKSLKSD